MLINLLNPRLIAACHPKAFSDILHTHSKEFLFSVYDFYITSMLYTVFSYVYTVIITCSVI